MTCWKSLASHATPPTTTLYFCAPSSHGNHLPKTQELFGEIKLEQTSELIAILSTDSTVCDLLRHVPLSKLTPRSDEALLSYSFVNYKTTEPRDGK